MKTAKLYWYAACSQCRDARKELERQNYTLEAHDFFREPFTEPELRALLKKLKLKPRDVFSFKSPSVKALKLNVETLTNDQMLSLMIQEPRLLRRPLIIINDKPIIGFDKSKLDALNESPPGKSQRT